MLLLYALGGNLEELFYSVALYLNKSFFDVKRGVL